MTWIPSPNFYKGRRRPLAFIVWHSTEGPERTGAARNVAASWFAKASSGVSAHIVADAGEVIECVKPGDTAWHAANGNADGYGIEIVGKAGQGDGWNDAYSLAAIRNACTWIRNRPALATIPARWLTDDQLRRRERGHTTHAQVTRVLGGTTHTDPGPGFPTRYVLQQLGGLGPTAPAPAGPRDLRRGDRGPDVLRLQQVLTTRYPAYASWSPLTEFFGDLTDRAVREFQRRTALPDTGVVDAATRRKLGL